MDNEKNPTPPAGDEPGDASAGKPRADATPVTPDAREASANTRAEAAPEGDDPTKETPASTPTAARVAPTTGASKTTSTPTPEINKGVSQGVAAKQPASVKQPAATSAAAKPPAAKPPAAAAAKQPGALVESTEDSPINKMRRRIVWASIVGFLGTSSLMFFRFFLPRAIFEPSSVFRVGFPGDYGFGVDTKWQQQYRIWVVKNSERLFVIYARCTHLGCTPDWKESENKFKCPCHGSGYDSEGVNFEGPAPRPMDRARVELDAEGQIVVDVGRLYLNEKGKETQFDDEGAFVRLA